MDQTPLRALQPAAGGVGHVRLLHSRDPFIRSSKPEQTLPELRVWVEVVAVRDHGAAEEGDACLLLLCVAGVALREGFEVGACGVVELFHACTHCQNLNSVKDLAMGFTLMPLIHLHHQHLELIGCGRGDLAAHPLLSPLPQAVELLVDEHVVEVLMFGIRVN